MIKWLAAAGAWASTLFALIWSSVRVGKLKERVKAVTATLKARKKSDAIDDAVSGSNNVSDMRDKLRDDARD